MESGHGNFVGQALEFLRRIECSVLLVHGKESHQVLQKDVKERFETIAHSSMVEVANAGHMVHRDNPEGLAKAVAAFFKSSSN